MSIVLSTFASTWAGSATGASVTVNVGAGDCVVAFVGRANTSCALLINSSAPTLISSAQGSSVIGYSYYMFPAGTGALAVSATAAAGTTQKMGVAAGVFTGVNNVTPVGTTGSTWTGAAQANSSIVIASSVGDLAVYGVFGVSNAPTGTANWSTVSGETQIAPTVGSSMGSLAFLYLAGAASVEFNVSAGTAWNWIAHAFTLNAAVASAPPSGGVSWWY